VSYVFGEGKMCELKEQNVEDFFGMFWGEERLFG
jgi:hypothetical protein